MAEGVGKDAALRCRARNVSDGGCWAVKKGPVWQPSVKSTTAPAGYADPFYPGVRMLAGALPAATRTGTRARAAGWVTASSAAKSAADAYAPAFAARACA